DGKDGRDDDVASTHELSGGPSHELGTLAPTVPQRPAPALARQARGVLATGGRPGFDPEQATPAGLQPAGSRPATGPLPWASTSSVGPGAPTRSAICPWPRACRSGRYHWSRDRGGTDRRFLGGPTTSASGRHAVASGHRLRRLRADQGGLLLRPI